MSEWLFSIIGVVFLSILFDLIYPSGKTNKFCKSIFGIISVFIMISPILNLGEIDTSQDYVDSELVSNINKSKEEVYKYKIENYLSDVGIDNVIVEVKGCVSEYDFEIENVYIDVSNIVLSEEMQNINKYEVIVNEVSNKFGLNSEKVFVYG